MKDFLVSNLPMFIWLITAIEVVFAVILSIALKKKKHPILLCVLLIDLGLFLDAFFIAMGSVVVLPIWLSRVRFIAHGMLIPLMFPICGYALKLPCKYVKAVWVFTGLIMVLGLAQSLAIVLEIKEIGGIIRHVSSDSSPAWAESISSMLSYGTVVPVIIVGIWVWIKQKTPYLFLSGFLMFAFAALGPATGNFDLIFFISMIGEVFLILFFYLYSNYYLKK